MTILVRKCSKAGEIWNMCSSQHIIHALWLSWLHVCVVVQFYLWYNLFLNWYKTFWTGLNFSNWWNFFKPVYLSTIQKGEISFYLPLSYSPILNESLSIFSIPQLPYPFLPNPHFTFLSRTLGLLPTVITTWPRKHWMQGLSYFF